MEYTFLFCDKKIPQILNHQNYSENHLKDVFLIEILVVLTKKMLFLNFNEREKTLPFNS